eukprot:4985062-Amphidinium_carterae.5
MCLRWYDSTTLAKRQRTTSRMTSPNYCSTSDNYYDSYYQLEDYAMTGEDAQYKHYAAISEQT